jgi:hypothetical protein
MRGTCTRPRAAHEWKDRDGAWRMDVRLAPDDGAFVHQALEDWTGKLVRAAGRGPLEPRPAIMADALAALVKEGPCKPIEVRLNASESALDRGYAEDGEQCELAGIGPVPITIARSLMSDARVTVLAREGGETVEVSPPKRTIPATLRRWLEATYPVCAVERCDVEHGLQIDHIIGVEEQGPTVRENTWRICTHHHKLKTFYGWKVVGEPGAWRLVPPDDPDPPPRPP